MAADETDFPLVMRGYDRGLVDDSIRDFRKELINLTNLNTQLASELREAQNRLIELGNEAAEAKNPSYAGVGAKAAQILSTAEELALRLVADAETEREGVLSTVIPRISTPRSPTDCKTFLTLSESLSVPIAVTTAVLKPYSAAAAIGLYSPQLTCIRTDSA